jgi:hypothetical protein
MGEGHNTVTGILEGDAPSMNPPTIAGPAAGDPRGQQPRGAIIELVQRHKGRKLPYTGANSILVPNHMRINGVAVIASCDAPATLCETAVDGMSSQPFAVTVQLLARALRVGGAPTFDPAAEGLGPDVISGAVVEVPEVDEWAEGDLLKRPHVLLNGYRVWTAGPIVVGRAATHGDDQYAALVTMTLLCRQLVVDDEPAEPAE